MYIWYIFKIQKFETHLIIKILRLETLPFWQQSTLNLNACLCDTKHQNKNI